MEGGVRTGDAGERAVALLLDHLAVAERGARSAPARAARAALPPGGGPSRVWGGTGRAAPADAAFLNGIAAHAIELDDTYEPASLHPGVAVWPAVLAVAEATAATTESVLEAAITGYDAACRAGDRLDPGLTYARGFHPTGVAGPIGAAAAVADLLGLDAAARADAEAIATSAAGGLLEFLADGAWTKPLHAGQAAAAGVRAAQLAAEGFRGPAGAMDGAHGFVHAFGPRAGKRPADRPRGHGVLATALKPYPCCRYSHPSLDLLLDIAAEPGFDAADVEAVECAVLGGGWDLVAGPPDVKLAVESQVDAQFSLPFTAALALTQGRAGLDDFESAAALAPRLAPLMRRVRCVRSPDLDAAYPRAWGGRVEVRLRGGGRIVRSEADALGSPANPLSLTQIEAKAATLVGEERAAAIAERVLSARAGDPVEALLPDRPDSAPVVVRNSPENLLRPNV